MKTQLRYTAFYTQFKLICDSSFVDITPDYKTSEAMNNNENVHIKHLGLYLLSYDCPNTVKEKALMFHLSNSFTLTKGFLIIQCIRLDFCVRFCPFCNREFHTIA